MLWAFARLFLQTGMEHSKVGLLCYTPFISHKFLDRTHTVIYSSVICIKVQNTLQNFSFCHFVKTLQQPQHQNLEKPRIKVLKVHLYRRIFCLHPCKAYTIIKPSAGVMTFFFFFFFLSGNPSWDDSFRFVLSFIC